FFQAEDGIRAFHVTGVQTCALPISVTGPRRNVVEPKRKVSTDKECVPQTPLEGFDVTVERVFLDDGREVKRQPFHTHYTPRDERSEERRVGKENRASSSHSAIHSQR